MMSYGGLQSNQFKMMPIREFMMHFDEGQAFGYLTWEEYFQREMDMISSKDLATLQQTRQKFK